MNPDRSFPEGREKDEKWSKKPIAPSSSHTTNAAATATRAYSFGVSDARNIPLTEEVRTQHVFTSYLCAIKTDIFIKTSRNSVDVRVKYVYIDNYCFD